MWEMWRFQYPGVFGKSMTTAWVTSTFKTSSLGIGNCFKIFGLKRKRRAIDVALLRGLQTQVKEMKVLWLLSRCHSSLDYRFWNWTHIIHGAFLKWIMEISKAKWILGGLKLLVLDNYHIDILELFHTTHAMRDIRTGIMPKKIQHSSSWSGRISSACNFAPVLAGKIVFFGYHEPKNH